MNNGNSIRKEQILKSWIMVEHLSEGNINVRDQAIISFQNIENDDYYSLIQNGIKKNNIGKNGGTVIYFDIYPFEDVIEILRKKFSLRPTEEELTTGDKFSLALYFDVNMSLNKDMTFFTESAFIRYFNNVPHEDEFHSFESDLKDKLAKDFENTDELPDQFNEAVNKVMNRWGVIIDNCRMQFVKNLDSDATNLHSFFISDLEKAKKIDTDNLDMYLHGGKAQRVDLDSRSDSANFNPVAFAKILMPDNYPLGRYPSSTKFALSLMQQAAVNLAVGFDNQQMRSVNGPPGTGKTTLLKDIFAEFVVKQAYDIAKMSEHVIKGTDATRYYENASIGVLPDNIIENEIVVASSNNGAVQNIVNELPIEKDIDEELLKDLKQADYFRMISNGTASEEWTEGEDGKKKPVLVFKPAEDEKEEKFWGFFSLEGGKSDNMKNILTNIKHVVKYLNEGYDPDPGVYKEFQTQYDNVSLFRERVQNSAKDITLLAEQERAYDAEEDAYKKDCREKESKISEMDNKLSSLDAIKQRELENDQKELQDIVSRKENVKLERSSVENYLKSLREHKPGLFASKSDKNDYHVQEQEGLARLHEQVSSESELSKREAEQRREIDATKKDIEICRQKRVDDTRSFTDWKNASEKRLNDLAEKVSALQTSVSDIKNSLDMTVPYERLQQSNPWFDESFRIMQTKLFILSLKVRKQFLYENRKNIKAATIIWESQEKYLENKQVIEAAYHWINLTVPVISSTFASF